MEVSNSPGISQQKINDLLQTFEFICAYIDYLLILTKDTDHVEKLELTLNKFKTLEFNII